MQAELAQPQQRQGQRRQRQAENQHAADIQWSALAMTFRQRACPQAEGHQREHTARGEHAAPSQCLQQQAREQGPQRQPHAERGAQQGEDTGTRRPLPGLCQQRRAGCQRRRRGNALQPARQIQP